MPYREPVTYDCIDVPSGNGQARQLTLMFPGAWLRKPPRMHGWAEVQWSERGRLPGTEDVGRAPGHMASRRKQAAERSVRYIHRLPNAEPMTRVHK